MNLFKARLARLVMVPVLIALVGVFVYTASESGPKEAALAVVVMVFMLALLGGVSAPLIVWCVGDAHRRAREYIMEAVDLTAAGKFSEARQTVQAAIRMNSAWQTNPDAVSLYKIILAGTAEGERDELKRVRLAAAQWPATTLEKLSKHPLIRVGVPLLYLAVLIFRLAQLYSFR